MTSLFFLYKSLKGIQRTYYIAWSMSYEAFHENNSFHFYSELSLSLPKTQTEKACESGTLPRVPFICTLQTLNFFDTQPSLSIWHFPEWFPTDFVSSLPENPCHIQIPVVDMTGLQRWSGSRNAHNCLGLVRSRAETLGSNAIALPTLLSLSSG